MSLCLAGVAQSVNFSLSEESVSKKKKKNDGGSELALVSDFYMHTCTCVPYTHEHTHFINIPWKGEERGEGERTP